MANIIYGTIKESIDTDSAIIRVRSYGYYNTSNFDNREELKIRFTNINQNCSIKSLADECLEITISEDPNNSDDILNGIGKVIEVVASEIFFL